MAGSGPASSMFPTRTGPPSSGDIVLPTPAASSGSIELPVQKPKRPASSGSVELPAAKPKRPASSGSVELPTSKPKRPASSGSIDLPTAAPKRPPSSLDFDLPTTSSAPLRESFDIPLLDDDLPSVGHGKKAAAAPDDALALFKDEPKTNRKLTGAEARAKIRRCPSCGGVVGVGMSLCNTCGLDLDTGQRIAPLDVFDDDMPVVHRAETPPLGVLFVGVFAILVNLLLAVASLVASRTEGSGMLFLLIVWIFGIYASVQFVRRKAIRPLFLALGLDVAIGVVFLIVLPIWYANMGTDFSQAPPEVVVKPADPADLEGPIIHNLADDLEKTGAMRKITWGIAMLLSYAALSVYLNTPAIKREFHRH